jgi:hypothetical protein
MLVYHCSFTRLTVYLLLLYVSFTASAQSFGELKQRADNGEAFA